MPVERREVYKKRTMVKDRVGMVRAPCYDLPPDGFVYGKKNEKDAEGAGEGDVLPRIARTAGSIEETTLKR